MDTQERLYRRFVEQDDLITPSDIELIAQDGILIRHLLLEAQPLLIAMKERHLAARELLSEKGVTDPMEPVFKYENLRIQRSRIEKVMLEVRRYFRGRENMAEVSRRLAPYSWKSLPKDAYTRKIHNFTQRLIRFADNQHLRTEWGKGRKPIPS